MQNTYDYTFPEDASKQEEKEMRRIKKLMAAVMVAAMSMSMVACGAGNKAADNGKTFKVGICNYVDDASLNQICDNIQNQLKKLGEENNVTFEVKYDNCNADANVMSQIVANFIADNVDLMVGVATPVAMTMQAATAENKIPVVFAAVSDPVACGVVDSLEKPGANVTGTSDYLDTTAIMNLILAAKPDIAKVGLLYDVGQDASTTAINDAKAFLASKGIEAVEHTGTNVSEVQLAASEFVSEGIEAIFTPSDNTIMQAELSIYEAFMNAGVLHFTGADSFALNGAFLGYGVDYANLGVETGNMICDILVNGKNPADEPVKTFDNGTATINTDVCAALGLNFDDLAKDFAPYATKVEKIQTAESFN